MGNYTFEVTKDVNTLDFKDKLTGLSVCRINEATGKVVVTDVRTFHKSRLLEIAEYLKENGHTKDV